MSSRLSASIMALALVVVVGACSTDEQGDGPTATTTVAAQASRGCTAPDADFAALGADGRLTSGGVERQFSVAAPDRAVGDEPVPLIVNLHGARATAEQQQATSELATRGPEAGFVVVAPQALGARPIWSLTADGPDITYVQDLVDEVEQRLCIDRSRVYLTGFSMGGMLSMRLACTAPDRFAAVAAVSGEIDYDDCPTTGRPPLLAFHGTADTVVRLDGSLDPGVALSIPFPDEPPRVEIVRRWAQATGCTVPPEETEIPPDVEHQHYDCTDSAVELYLIDGGGHTWPGSTPGPYTEALGGTTSQTIDATSLILEFFGQHTRAS